MFYGHNAMGDQEITLVCVRIGGAGANQRESIMPKQILQSIGYILRVKKMCKHLYRQVLGTLTMPKSAV